MSTLLKQVSSDPRLSPLRVSLGADAELHLVGGTVRDALLGKPHSDIDLATRLTPDQLRLRLEAASIHVIPTGLKHQTVTAVPITGCPAVEITTFRGAGMDPAGGVVAADTILEDLRYRDFTINAMAYCLERCELIDPNGGQADLDAGLVRAVGDPAARFSEDPLRTMRMVRFAAALNFTIVPSTFSAARSFVDKTAAVSVERLREELFKILVAPGVDQGLRQLHDLGLLKLMLPEVDLFYGFEQNRFHKADLFNHTLEVVTGTEPTLVLRLAALLHDVGKPPTLSVDEQGERHFYLHEDVGAKMAQQILLRLRASGELTDQVCTLIKTHMRPLDAGPGGLRRLLRDTGDIYSLWRVLKEADASACKINPENLRQQFAEFDANMAEILKGPKVSPLKSLAVNGNDLQEIGVPFGRQIGELLRALHERVLDDPSLNDKETLLKLARQISGPLP